MTSKEMTDIILSECRSEGATDVVVSMIEMDEIMIRFSNNQITVTKDIKENTASIFAFVKERRAGTEMSDLSKRSLRSAARRVVSEAKSAPPGDVYSPLPEGPFTYSSNLVNQPKIDLSPDNMVGHVEDAIEAGLEEGAKRMAGSLIARNIRFTLQTSGDVFGITTKSSIELSIRAFGDEYASGHSVSISGTEDGFDPAGAGREAGIFSKLSSSPVEGQAGEYEALLGPLVFADLVNQVGMASSAFYVDAGLSFLAGKIDEQVASPKITISDDGTLPGSYGSSAFDLEGLPVRKTTILDKGKLKGFLHNSTTAKKMETETTANAGLISPRAFNLVVEGEGKDDLISNIDKGIYVTNDWYLRYQNWTTGDFSMIPRDAMFLIEKGELKAPIRELRISDNIPRMLSSIEELGNDKRWIKWWEVETPTLSPSALIGNTRFTKSRM